MTELQYLNSLKRELLKSLDELESNSPAFALIHYIVRNTDVLDPDFKEALIDGTAFPLIDLLLSCYHADEMFYYLAEKDFDIFMDYRYTTREYKHDFSDDEWIEICDNALLYTDEIAVYDY